MGDSGEGPVLGDAVIDADYRGAIGFAERSSNCSTKAVTPPRTNTQFCLV